MITILRVSAVVISFLLLILCGCAEKSACERFYVQDNAQTFPESQFCRFVQMTPQAANEIAARQKGQIIALGHSNFQAPPQSEQSFIDFGKSIGANVVIVESRFLRTVQGQTARTVYGSTYNQTDSTASATVRNRYGQTLGTVDASGTETSTGVVPVGIVYDNYQYDLYEYLAGFLRDASLPGLEPPK